MRGMTLHAHRVSVALMGVAVLVATADGFAQSYSGLYHWGLEHGLNGWKAQSFPLMVDLFIAVGELGLFTLALEGHKLTKSGMAWADLALPTTIATAGWGVSLAFNVGTHHKLADQLTAAVPPVASMLGLLVLLRTLHRVISRGVWEQERPTVVVERADGETAPAVPGSALPTLRVTPLAMVATASPGRTGAAVNGWSRGLAETTLQNGPRTTETGPETAETTRDHPIASAGLDHPQTAAEAHPIPDTKTAPETTETALPNPETTGLGDGDIPDPDPLLPEVRERFAQTLMAGQVPSKRRIKDEMRVGFDRASRLHEALTDH